MKMNRQTRTFARQVQVDLLGLSDAYLFQTVHFWVNGSFSDDVSEETLRALGYTPAESDARAHVLSALSESELAGGMQWLAPAPQQLRERLTDMSVQFFVQHVLPLAFQSLHLRHPEWDEGATFNAHLANHLRYLGMKR